MKELTGAVLLITHQRVHQLRRVIEHLELSWVPTYRSMHIVFHEGQSEIFGIISQISFVDPIIMTVNRASARSAKEAISRNIFDGLEVIFSNPTVDFVTVIEDDILVSEDFLHFNSEVMQMEFENPGFKGINGFSGVKCDLEQQYEYGHFRYGFGWGWSITRETWVSLFEIWSDNFLNHWDGLIESHVRTGYVVMPRNSKVKNIGFDSSASHTGAGCEQEERLNASYLASPALNKSAKYSLSKFDLHWRWDATEYVKPKSFIGSIIQLLCNLLPLLSSLPNDSPLLIHFKNKFRAVLLRLIQLMSPNRSR
jgi:hypothetical protein